MSFFDLKKEVIGNNIHNSVYDKSDNFWIPFVNVPWFSGDVPRFPSYGIYISKLGRFSWCCIKIN